MKIVVTGGSGLVGKYVVSELLEHHHTVAVLDIKPPAQDVEFLKVDVLNLEEVRKAVKGYDVVVHMAGIPHPLNDPAEKVFFLNVNGTFNVLQAAVENGVKKVVFTSSESTLGFAFMTKRMAPEYVPIDEQHPLRPQDPYGLSKVIGEQICRTYSARHEIRTVCLREPWIWVPEGREREMYKTLVMEHHKWSNNLWAFVHVHDVARAHRLAVEKDLDQLHEVFFICAAENWTGINSRSLLKAHFPEVWKIGADFVAAASFLSYRKAHDLLGYEPQHTVHDILF
ncbi:MAG TPA: NAD(P)-dependent oxidoreductase [Bacteroidota bacterium]|nr:NAD(P)-dependent oxidoreductase [Bacteroidota bacterium]